MRIFEKLNLFSKKTHSAKINGQTFTFHPISLPVLYQLQTAFKSLGNAIAGFAGTRQDVTTTEETTHDANTGSVVVTKHLGSVNPELAKMRSEQKKAAAKEMLDAVFADENRLMVGRVLADSLKDDFQDPQDSDIEQFMSSIDLATLAEFIKGMIEANSQVFGPFLNRLKAQLKTQMTEILGDKNESQSSPSDEETEKAPAETPEW